MKYSTLFSAFLHISCLQSLKLCIITHYSKSCTFTASFSSPAQRRFDCFSSYRPHELNQSCHVISTFIDHIIEHKMSSFHIENGMRAKSCFQKIFSCNILSGHQMSPPDRQFKVLCFCQAMFLHIGDSSITLGEKNRYL